MNVKKLSPKICGKLFLCVWHFWIWAICVVLISIIIQVFDFSLVPPSYKGLFITRSYYGLHSWASANRAWGAKSHVKYGLRYTKGYPTLVVGNPPPEHPQHYVSHPSLGSLVTAFGMLLFGSEDWGVRLFDIILSIPVLLLIIYFLSKLFSKSFALLSVLLLVNLPIYAYFAFDILTIMTGIWALYRYLLLTGQLQDSQKPRKRYFIELAIALFLMIQLNWIGVFYAFVIGLHYVICSLFQRKIYWKLLAVLVLVPLMSLILNFYVMISGFHNNILVESAQTATSEFDSNQQNKQTVWGQIKTLYKWRSNEGERESFKWKAWLAQNTTFALSNFTIPILVLLIGYLFYLFIVCIPVLLINFKKLFKNLIYGDILSYIPLKIPRSFKYMWFFLLPGLLFLFTFKGLFWEHQYWQSPLICFVTFGATLGIFLIGDFAGMINPWLGRSWIAIILFVIILFSNQGLVAYRAIRDQSPRTIELFKKLNGQIPPDKALLTFKDFIIQQSDAKVPFYRPEYAWYLDREMIVANVWQFNSYRPISARVVDIVSATVKEIQKQARTGRFPIYFIPDVGKYNQDSLDILQVSSDTSIKSLGNIKLDRMLNDQSRKDNEILYWEKYRRYQKSLIGKLKKLYHYEYFENNAILGDENFCYRGVTPCYLFDLNNPKD